MMKRRIWAVFLCGLIGFTAARSSVMVNQAGYLPNGQKFFYSDAAADSFTVIEKGTGTVVYSGAVILAKANDPATGRTIYRGDFSALKRSGIFYIALSPLRRSYDFPISDTVFQAPYRAALKGFYFQRCGQALSPFFAGIYARGGCHGNDGTFHATAETTGFRTANGGWHDAGDYGKYIVNAAITVGTLQMAYEMFPVRFSQDDLGILESGNGIPDILDEIRFELNWMMKMQHTNGGVFFKLTREQFEGFVMPSADNGARYLYQISTTATGDFAAVFARASRIYKPFDKKFSDSCLSVARKAWTYLTAHPTIVPAGGFKNPAGTATGEYGDGNDSDERLWAAAELFSTTGEAAFNSYYTTRYASGGLISQMSWPNVRAMAHLAYLYTAQPSASALNKIALKQSLIDHAASLMANAAKDGFSLSITTNEYYWGSNSGVLNNAILLILASREANEPVYLNAALNHLNYIFGTNAHDLSFVTGIGVRRVMKPHHRPSSADGITEPVPGLLAGGPEQGRSDDVLKAKFSASTPPALIYTDEEGSYASNEIAINWNAPLVFVAGYFAAEGQTTGIGSAAPVIPEEYRLKQNYPNPFNPQTSIEYYVGSQDHISLSVYDMLGKKIATLVDRVQSPGPYSVQFDGNGLASGFYFYNLHSNDFSESRKMMLLK